MSSDSSMLARLISRTALKASVPMTIDRACFSRLRDRGEICFGSIAALRNRLLSARRDIETANIKGSRTLRPLAVLAVQAPVQAAGNPWPTLASLAGKQPGPLLAHDDRYWHDGRWHDRRDDWRIDKWRREQARREAERHRDWERQQDRAMRHRYEDDHRYYRR